MKTIGMDPAFRSSRLWTFVFPAAVLWGTLIAARLLLGGQAPALVSPERGSGTEGLAGYLTHITTDKPLYRVGETAYIRGIQLSAQGHLPVSEGGPGTTASFEIKGPKGETVFSGVSPITDSVMGFSWPIPSGQAGGEYTVRIFHPSGDPPAERKFDIRAYRAPRLKSQIVFIRDGYGPGDTVAANLHVERAEGGVPASARVTVTARVDGVEIWNGQTTVDASGNAGASFKLPGAIARGEGVIAMVIEDGGVVETATKAIPILLQTVDLAIYPEGGDLVAGLPNRVYIEGKTPARKPADIAGVIVTGSGTEVGSFRTEHEGRGRFSFVPVAGESYALKITEPAGIRTTFPLPAAKRSGLVLSTTSDVIGRQEDAQLQLVATNDSVYEVVLSQRGQELSSRLVMLRANRPATITLPAPEGLDGVLVATVYDDQKTPIAERLLFREPARNLRVEIVPDRPDYVPGDKVTLRITTTDESGKPVPSMVGLAVTDSSVLEMIEKREQAPSLPVMVLLENEVRDLADAHVYLDATNPKAPLATDLLLGTQGWRRFATVDLPKFVSTYEDAARRALGIRLLMTGHSLANVATQVEVRMALAANAAVREQLRKAPEALAVNDLLQFELELDNPVPPAAKLEFKEAKPDAGRDEPLNELQRQGQQGQQGRGGGGRGALGFRDVAARQPVPIRTVREYAHTRRPAWTEGSRTDFTETVYWNSGIKTDAANGRATVSFSLSDSVTSFRVLADGVSANGALGAGVSHVESVTPFSIEPKLPLQVTSGDVIQLPIGVINGMSRELRNVTVKANADAGLHFAASVSNSAVLSPKERARQLLRIEAGRDFSGLANLTFDAAAGPYRDTVVRKLDIQPLGFPYEKSAGGMLQSNGVQVFEFTLPDSMVSGSLATRATVYPTPLASMTDALESLLQQPYGCFEQTSSTSYPMVMAQQYFLTHSGVDPKIIEKAKDLLEASYKRLTGFESRSRGYEWFGADPGHEALTAYGLMQFNDMSRVRSVDQTMVDRTRAWLLGRRDGKGGFSLNSKALDSFGRAPAETTNAYIVWALVESGEKGLEREIAAVKASASSTSDSYIVALAANILHATGDRAGARQLMDKLVKGQQTSGQVHGATTSITQSGGQALAIETTALAVLAWLREPDYMEPTHKGLRWIVESNKSGRFGSTQSTVLALRSIIAYDAANARPKAPGRLVLTVDGKRVGTPVEFSSNAQGAVVVPDFTRELGPGRHTVTLRMEGGSAMPFSMGVKYHSLLPDSSEQAQIGIQVALKNAQVQEGNVTEATVSIANRSDQAIPTPVAIVGIPGGLEVRHDQLKELVKSGKIDAYEVLGREVVLYWRHLKGNDRLDFPLSLVAAIPGSYTGPASRAYLYYTDEYKNWAPGLKVTITPR